MQSKLLNFINIQDTCNLINSICSILTGMLTYKKDMLTRNLLTEPSPLKKNGIFSFFYQSFVAGVFLWRSSLCLKLFKGQSPVKI